jgi:type IX secretion system PorP/SprF family membrane protein
MKKIIISLICTIPFIGWTQQDAMFTHYAFNTLAVNPGYAGSREALTITGLHRSQWVGFEGAPITQTFTLHSPVFNEKLGIGFSMVNDKIGPMNSTSLYGDFAYKINVGETGKLSFGLKGGINLLQGTLNSLPTVQENDPAFANNIQSNILPNFGFGMYYSTSKYYVGLSTPKLLENNFAANNGQGTVAVASEKRHYFAIAGAVFDLNQNLKIRPTTFVKVTSGAPVEVDLTALFILQDKIEFGPMYRTGDAAGVLLGYYFTPQLRFGYSFDWSHSNRTFSYNRGSHEIMLRYDFIYKDKSRVFSPRYF